MIDAPTLAIVIGTFLVAGLVKGVIGLGLPTVSLAALTAALGLREAIVLMLAPSFVTNVWQALAGPHLLPVTKRLAAFLVLGVVGTAVAALALGRADSALLTGLLGITLIAYAGFGALGRAPNPPAARERWLSPVLGAATGVLAGLTGSFVLPAVPYFQSLGLPRHALVQAMGVWFTLATVTLALALQGQRLLPADAALLSALGVVPALVGMVLGARIRGALSEAAFRRVFFAALAVLGVYILARTLV